MHSRLDSKTMFNVRTWERFQFLINLEHHTVKNTLSSVQHLVLPVTCL
jgi:hypothetical protein